MLKRISFYLLFLLLSLGFILGLFLLSRQRFPSKVADQDTLSLLQPNVSPDSVLGRQQWQSDVRHDSILFSLEKQGKYKEALIYLQGVERRRGGPFSTPFYLLSKGNIYYAAHDYDSASHYYNLASTSIDAHIAAEAQRRMCLVEAAKGNYRLAYQFYNYYHELLNLDLSQEESRDLYIKYKEIQMQNQVANLELSKRWREVWLLVLSLAFLITGAGAYIYYSHHRRKERERDLQAEALRLNQENEMLKQAEELQRLRRNEAELSVKQAEVLQQQAELREKEAMQRESLFRRMSAVHKIPSLGKEEECQGKILLTDFDWEEIRQTVDEGYYGFTRRLQKDFEELTLSDLHFCCLLKINVSLQDLSDIYCISKTSISKKKFRLKRDKFHLEESDLSLDDFLRAY